MLRKMFFYLIAGLFLTIFTLYSSKVSAEPSGNFANQLTVNAEGSKVSSLEHANAVVFVSFNGNAVDFLEEEHFSTKTNAQIVPPGGAAVEITEFNNQGSGFYYLKFETFDGSEWGENTRIFPIVVEFPDYNMIGRDILKIKQD